MTSWALDRRLPEKDLKLLTASVFNYITSAEDFERHTKELFGFMADNQVEAHIYKRYSLEDAAQAHRDLEARRTMGKLLLKV